MSQILLNICFNSEIDNRFFKFSIKKKTAFLKLWFIIFKYDGRTAGNTTKFKKVFIKRFKFSNRN
jgi:hypothetical protein